MENNEINENDSVEEEVLESPPKIEKISLSEISDEKQKQEDEETNNLVRRIMNKILEIK